LSDFILFEQIIYDFHCNLQIRIGKLIIFRPSLGNVGSSLLHQCMEKGKDKRKTGFKWITGSLKLLVSSEEVFLKTRR